MGNCFEGEPNFNHMKSVFQVLNAIENENNKLTSIASKTYTEPNLAKKCITKTETILKFVKNKPLYYLEERLSKFTEILTRFYAYTYRHEVDKYMKAEEDLQEFIFNMMDFYNGIRFSVVDKVEKTQREIEEINYREQHGLDEIQHTIDTD